jgi:hypothetical protein
MRKFCRLLAAPMLAAVVCAAPVAALADTTVLVLSGSGELAQWSTSTSVETATPLAFEWWTTDAGATGGRWDVEQAGAQTPIATGMLSGTPNAQHPRGFTLPAGTFLSAQTPVSAVTYTLHVSAVDGNVAGAPSQPVTITEVKAGTASFGNLSNTPATQPPEPGHPAATLLGYKPIVYENMSQKSEGLVDLDFINPSSTPTDAVFVTVSDLKQVLQQTDQRVLVPSLPPGEHFRVSVAMGKFMLTSDTYVNANGSTVVSGDPNPTTWNGRSGQGVSLQVGTAKVNSPYVQYQPPILTGPTEICVGERCRPNSPPRLALFRPSGLRTNNDESIAVGQDFLYLEDYNFFDVYAKKARQYRPVDLSNTRLSANTAASQLAWKGGGDATLFQDYWYPGSMFNVNPAAIPSGPIKCNPATPTFPVSNGDVARDNNGFPTTSCINQFYDARLTYDVERRRFWLVSHAANDVDGNPNDSCGSLSQADCLVRKAQVAHQVFVAVSKKSEAPSQGFLTYKNLDNADADWPIMAVQGRYLLISYHSPFTPPPQSTATPLRLYDADALAQGVQTELKPAFTAADFANGTVRMPKHHNIKHDIAFIVSTNGV